MPDAPPGDIAQSSGTAVAQGPTPFSTSHTNQPSPGSSNGGVPTPPSDDEEQHLESHEVIELQTFSERKAWIEQKIKFLEKMPPVEVFVGLDAVAASAEQVPGLPTRDELEQWIIEHDAIEKETEIFDKGELMKLRQLTKAATQRNLSPADTDLIEITLTTIYTLDKLLHLLRDRSENLELLGIRLTWEEARIAAWIDCRKIIQDLQTFLETRVRWNPSCYDDVVKQEDQHSLMRRASVTSMASNTSDSSLSNQAFSRSVRFKMAELLSRDAAQFGARVTSLRHGKIAAAGKALDKLIDHSRRPVPEVLLDEQDKLEEKAIAEMEHIGKFVMSLVMQWRKSDEIYVETMKDKATAQNLYEEIETARLHHPTARQSASFLSRTDTLLKRLTLRGNPASSLSTFPRPDHPLFTGQQEFNKTLTESLSAELLSTTELVRQVDTLVKSYSSGYEAVKHVENLTSSASSLSSTFIRVLAYLQDGVLSDNGDGSPLNLTTEACLDPSRHSAFLALLPSVMQDNAQAVESFDEILRSSDVAMNNLNLPGIDPAFATNAALEFQRLRSLHDQAMAACADMKARTDRLREARRIWGVMGGTIKQLEGIGQKVTGAIEHARWRQVSGQAEPSPRVGVPPEVSMQVLGGLHRIENQLGQEVEAPLATLSQTLEPPLIRWFGQVVAEVHSSLKATVKMTRLLQSIQQQGSIMQLVHEESNQLHQQIEDAVKRVTSHIDRALSSEVTTVEAGDMETHVGVTRLGNAVTSFIGGLPQRMLFIGDQANISHIASDALHKSPLMNGVKPRLSVEAPADLALLDNVVRTDSNTFAMRLSGKMERLTQAISHYWMTCMGKEIDDALRTTVADIDAASHGLACWKSKLSEAVSSEGDVLVALQSLSQLVEDSTHVHKTRIPGLFSPLRELLQKLEAIPGAHDLYVARRSAVDYAESRYKGWESDVSVFKNDIAHQQKVEGDRLTRLYLEKEQRQREEMVRAAAEEAEKLRLEEERMAFEEEKRRLEEERRAEGLRRRAEDERVAAEEVERARLERQRLEVVEKQRLEEERLAEARRSQLEKQHAVAEEAEKARLRDERTAVEERLRLVEEQLAQERRSMVEKERFAAEALERQKRETQLAEERRLQAEEERRKQLEKDGESRQQKSSKGTNLPQALVLNGNHPDERKEAESLDQLVTPRIARFPSASMRDLGIEDVFSLQVASPEKLKKTKEMADLQTQILALRKRLRSISINEVSRPTKSTAPLPDLEQFRRMSRDFSDVVSAVSLLPASLPDPAVDVELRSLRSELEASTDLMSRIEKLAHFSEEIRLCDAALSDLLEHIDSYPALPTDNLSSPYKPPSNLPPEEQLSARLSFTRTGIQNMSSNSEDVKNDSRVDAEKTRVLQTWSELEDMATDRLKEQDLRPDSPTSSSASPHPVPATPMNTPVNNGRGTRKKHSYANLSVSSTSSQGGLLAPPPQLSQQRRVVSGGSTGPSNRLRRESRSPSQLSSFSSNRAVSGPMNNSLYGSSTFASRQRTASLSTSISAPPVKRPLVGPPRLRTQTTQDKRSSSPTVSETSSSVRTHTRSSTSMSSWARAPRNSLSSLVPNIATIIPTPQRKIPGTRKKYIADPKNKLDVAVGEVVNKLPVAINIEGVADTWRDKSGKYWIGNQDPKLCFCRILRSQTVMVRVGGGWSELSRFIRDHFAESFRIMPESPPRPGAKEEKWISSATLLEKTEQQTTPPAPPRTPRTPEPTIPFVTSFTMRTPTRQSPRSVKSTSPSVKGSPLTPMQFIRRADVETILRPVTPSKPPTLRTRNPAPHTNTLNRSSVWRP